MSQRTLNPSHRIFLQDIAEELCVSSDPLLVLLTELENRGLIKIHHTAVVAVSLTQYGATHDNPPGGFKSEGG